MEFGLKKVRNPGYLNKVMVSRRAENNGQTIIC